MKFKSGDRVAIVNPQPGADAAECGSTSAIVYRIDTVYVLLDVINAREGYERVWVYPEWIEHEYVVNSPLWKALK